MQRLVHDPAGEMQTRNEGERDSLRRCEILTGRIYAYQAPKCGELGEIFHTPMNKVPFDQGLVSF